MGVAKNMEDGPNLGKDFYKKVQAGQEGIGKAFVDSIEEKTDEPGILDNIAHVVRSRGNSLYETTTSTLSRLSSTAAPAAEAVESSLISAGAWFDEVLSAVQDPTQTFTVHPSLVGALDNIRTKDIAVPAPGFKLIRVELGSKVGDLEK